jgi:hypothetical protein
MIILDTKTNGQGDFGSEQIISDNADGAVEVFTDINGDGGLSNYDFCIYMG